MAARAARAARTAAPSRRASRARARVRARPRRAETARVVAAAGTTNDDETDDADARAARRARSWASTNDARYARLARGRRDDDASEDSGFRAASAASLARATRRGDARRGDSTSTARERASEAYWGEDEGLNGWARMMGEDADGRAVDGRIRRREAKSKADLANAATAYKRGTERPWEAARRARDARRAARDASGGSAGESGAASAFERAGLPEGLAARARDAGLRRTTEIQRLAIPELVRGKSAVLLAETGSGKTFAYLLPILASMTTPGRKGTKRSGRCCPACVVLTPSVELGKQVAHAAELAAYWSSASADVPTPSVFALLGKEKKLVRPKSKGGGAKTGKAKKTKSTSADKSKLAGDEEAIPEFRNADILVCTPARLLKLIKDEWVLLGRLRHVVVDEADEMLSSGFARDVGGIIAATYGEGGVNRFDARVQYVFAAATMREAQPLLDAFPAEAAEEFEWISTAQFGRVHPQLKTRVDDVDGAEAKFAALADALERHKQYKTLIFVNSPEEADEVVQKLDERDVVALAFHGKAKERGVVLDDFISGELTTCVCTDLAARGIDFPQLHHVVQYGAAPSVELHVHRCGRTARTGQEGPFYVTCVVDSRAEDISEDVALALGLKRRYVRAKDDAAEESVVDER